MNILQMGEEVAALSSSHPPLAYPDLQLSHCDRCCLAQVNPSPPWSHFDNPSLVEEFQILFKQQQVRVNDELWGGWGGVLGNISSPRLAHGSDLNFVLGLI